VTTPQPHGPQAGQPGRAGLRGGEGVVRGALPSLPTGLVAAVTLVLAFAVAQTSGVRALGGVLLLVGGAWCAWRVLPRAGVPRVLVVLLLGLVCFVGAHLLASALGAWPSVLLAAAVLGVATTLLVDRPARPVPAA
jgi:hypothetical protein